VADDTLLADSRLGALEGQALQRDLFVAAFCQRNWQKAATKELFSGACIPTAPAGELASSILMTHQYTAGNGPSAPNVLPVGCAALTRSGKRSGQYQPSKTPRFSRSAGAQCWLARQRARSNSSSGRLVGSDQHACTCGDAVNQPQHCVRAPGKQLPSAAENQRMDHQEILVDHISGHQ
jgi:hypothetical protein